MYANELSRLAHVHLFYMEEDVLLRRRFTINRTCEQLNISVSYEHVSHVAAVGQMTSVVEADAVIVDLFSGV